MYTLSNCFLGRRALNSFQHGEKELQQQSNFPLRCFLGLRRCLPLFKLSIISNYTLLELLLNCPPFCTSKLVQPVLDAACMTQWWFDDAQIILYAKCLTTFTESMNIFRVLRYSCDPPQQKHYPR